MFGHRFKDKDVEKLFSGRTPDDEDLARLVPFAETLRRAGGRIPPEAEVNRVAAEAARVARTASQDALTGARPVDRPGRGRSMRLTPRVAGALVAVVVLFSTTGVAFAANGAAPGDTLYGFDRALERISLGAGGLHERLDEAAALAGRGAVEEGLAHAAEALAQSEALDEGTAEAQAAIMIAANAVTMAGEGEIVQVRRQVAEMLHWMATTQATGRDFGRGASELAQGFSPNDDGRDGAPGSTTGTESGQDPGGQSGSTPGSPTGTTSAGQPTGTTAGQASSGTSDHSAGPTSTAAGQPATTSGGQPTPTTGSQPDDDPNGQPDRSGPAPSSTTATTSADQGGNGSDNQTQGTSGP